MTITLLARMARFVIADISDAKSVLQELRAIVPELPSVPVQPVIVSSQEEPGMFDFYRHFPWFLPVHRYDTPAQLLTELSDRVIEPLEPGFWKFGNFTSHDNRAGPIVPFRKVRRCRRLDFMPAGDLPGRGREVALEPATKRELSPTVIVPMPPPRSGVGLEAILMPSALLIAHTRLLQIVTVCPKIGLAVICPFLPCSRL
jgi:hypothetical protein